MLQQTVNLEKVLFSGEWHYDMAPAEKEGIGIDFEIKMTLHDAFCVSLQNSVYALLL